MKTLNKIQFHRIALYSRPLLVLLAAHLSEGSGWARPVSDWIALHSHHGKSVYVNKNNEVSQKMQYISIEDYIPSTLGTQRPASKVITITCNSPESMNALKAHLTDQTRLSTGIDWDKFEVSVSVPTNPVDQLKSVMTSLNAFEPIQPVQVLQQLKQEAAPHFLFGSDEEPNPCRSAATFADANRFINSVNANLVNTGANYEYRLPTLEEAEAAERYLSHSQPSHEYSRALRGGCWYDPRRTLWTSANDRSRFNYNNPYGFPGAPGDRWTFEPTNHYPMSRINAFGIRQDWTYDQFGNQSPSISNRNVRNLRGALNNSNSSDNASNNNASDPGSGSRSSSAGKDTQL